MLRQGCIVQASLALAFLGFGAACSGVSSEQRNAADAALRALRKIASATEVGISYQSYGDLLIETKCSRENN